MSDIKNRNVSASKRRARQRKQRNRRIAMTVALVLVVALASIGGTIAWLTATTAPVTNTFTASDIDITLTETGATNNANSYKMVPGQTITKDPKVSVAVGSEACWLFVKLEKSNNFNTFMTYDMENGWKQLKDAEDKDVPGVYYRKVSDTLQASNPAEFTVIKNNKVTVKETVTKGQLDELSADTYPTLKVTAYAIQQYGIGSVDATEDQNAFAAWRKIQDDLTNP